MILVPIQNQIIKILQFQHKKHFKQKMSKEKKQRLLQNLIDADSNNQLFYETFQSGKIGYFFTLKKMYRGDFLENVYFVQDVFCHKNMRRKFYSKLKKQTSTNAKKDKIKRVVIEIFADDFASKKHFEQKGTLTYIELIGKTQKSLQSLNNIKNTANVKLTKLQQKDISTLVKLDLESHIKDKTSRMHNVFKKPNAIKNMKSFYKRLYKEKTFYVAKINNQPVGGIGYFLDKKNKVGLIASIFVAHQYQGLGISKLLYQKTLQTFIQKKFPHFIGASTTSNVLNTAKSINRVPTKYCYILNIHS